MLLFVGCKGKTDTKMTVNDDKLMVNNELHNFAKRYTDAWCSQSPGLVAEFFSVTGSLSVNDDPPATGREEIAKVAEGFMSSFPDMIVRLTA